MDGVSSGYGGLVDIAASSLDFWCLVLPLHDAPNLFWGRLEVICIRNGGVKLSIDITVVVKKHGCLQTREMTDEINAIAAERSQKLNLVTVIVNYRAGRLLSEGLIEHVSQHRALGATRLYIVDNHSENGDEEFLERFIQHHDLGDVVHFIAHPENEGFGAGNNVALHAMERDNIQADYVLFLNPDATLQDGCIRKLTEFLEDNPGVGIVGAQQENLSSKVQTSAFRFFSVAGEFESTVRTGPFSRLLSTSIVALPAMLENTKVDWVSGAVFMVRANMLNDIGYFDEDFFLYFEETDLMKRAKNAGYDVWHIPQARAVHIEGYSTGANEDVGQESPPQWYWYRARNLYFQKHHSLITQLSADCAWLTGSLLYMVRCLLTGKPISSQSHKIRGFLKHWRKTEKLL